MRSSGIRLGLLLFGVTLILAGVFLTAFPQWITWPGVVLVVATLWDKVLGWAERLHRLTEPAETGSRAEAKPAGERRVTVHGEVRDSVIVTGDGNTVEVHHGED